MCIRDRIVGMLTVVCILGLVVFSGKMLLIALNATGFRLNKADMEEPKKVEGDIPRKVIAAAIQKWSSNKATPLNIKRIK